MLKLSMSEYTSDLESTCTEEDKENPSIGNRSKRTLRPPRRFLVSDDDDDNDGDDDDMDGSSELAHAEEQPLSKERRMEAPSPPKVPRSLTFQKRPLSPVSKTKGIARKTPETPIHNDVCLEQIRQYARIGTIRTPRASPSDHQPVQLPSPSPSASPSAKNDYSDKLANSLVELTQEVRRMRINMAEARDEARQSKKLLTKILAIVSNPAQVPAEEQEQPQPLPLSSFDEFKEMEQRLEGDKAFARNLAVHLSKFGAPDVKKSTKCILEATMTFSLMTKFNWKGQRGEKIAMHNQQLVSVICAAVRHNRATKDATNEEIKAIIKDHLRYADKRLQRHNKKPAGAKDTTDLSEDEGTQERDEDLNTEELN
ncbi:uncharacterized protein LOC134788706 [Penaeus indicus]|uniref:uncharacterized protein LOC134788706 n=1 Tax=Penaeus indicus TaxID=29960 RepID=UPI00300C0C4A